MKTSDLSLQSTKGLPKEKNYSVAIVRVLSMFMIIGCHLASWLGINTIAMILNVGVYTFLIISGVLYASKRIDKPVLFIKKRWIKLCIPMYCFAILLLIYNLINTNYSAIKSVPTYLFNLQGTAFIVRGINFPQMLGLDHLWFLTAIMCCYILLLLLKKTEESFSDNKKAVIIFLVLLFVFDIVFAYTIKVQLCYFFAFFLGYFIGKIKNSISVKSYIISTLGMVVALATRLFSKRLLDGTITYDDVIVPFSHIMLATWIYITAVYVNNKLPMVTKSIAKNKAFELLDELSMYVYITHYMFLIGPFYVSEIPCHTLIQLIVFFVGAFVSAHILKYMSNMVFRLFKWR